MLNTIKIKVKNFGNFDSLIFKLKTGLLGNFYEGLNTYDLNTCNEDAIFNPTQQRNSST